MERDYQVAQDGLAGQAIGGSLRDANLINKAEREQRQLEGCINAVCALNDRAAKIRSMLDEISGRVLGLVEPPEQNQPQTSPPVESEFHHLHILLDDLDRQLGRIANRARELGRI